jgi:predicted MFS family arabinose efflux permease
VSQIGIVLAARTLALAGALLVGGVLADRLPRRRIMVAADLVRVGSQGLLGGLLIAGAASVPAVAVLAGVTGAAAGFFNPASTGLLPAVVPVEHLQPANGLRATAMAAGEIAGPALGGVLVAAAGPGWAIGLDAATFAVSALLLGRLALPPHAAAAPASFLADLRAGWTAFRSLTWLWALVCGAAAIHLLFGAWNVLGPVAADRRLGGAVAWGTVSSAVGVGALIGGVLGIRARPRRPLVLSAVATGVFTVPLALLAAEAPTLVVAAGALLLGTGMMLGNSVWESTLQSHVPAGTLSRVSAYDWFGSLAFQPAGLAIWGPVSALIGLDASLWLAAALIAVTTAALVSVPAVRGLRAAQVAA